MGKYGEEKKMILSYRNIGENGYDFTPEKAELRYAICELVYKDFWAADFDTDMTKRQRRLFLQPIYSFIDWFCDWDDMADVYDRRLKDFFEQAATEEYENTIRE